MKALITTLVIAAVAYGVRFGMNQVPSEQLPGFLQATTADRALTRTVPETARTPHVTAAPVGSGSALAEEEAAPEAADEPGEEPADAAADTTQVAAAVAAADPEPATAPAPVAAEAAPAPAPAPIPATEPAPRRAAPPAQAAARSAPEPRPEPGPAPAEADAIRQWWPNPDSIPQNQLKLTYAGQVQGQPAIALLFSAPLNLGTLQANVQIRTEEGDAVAGHWTLGKNPRMAVFTGLARGRYTVILSPAIADTRGFILGMSLQGPVYIR